MSQQINVFGTGWVSLNFYTGLLFPSDRMLVELLQPKIDPMTVTLQWIGLIAAEQIPDLGSQLLLQAYSNDIISIIRDEQKANGHLLDKLSIEQGLNRWQSRYHQAVMMYIGAFFPAKTQNLGKLARAAMQIENVNFQYRSMGNIAAISDDLKNLVGFDFETNTVAEDAHKMYLRQRFLEYRISDNYLNVLYLKAIEDKGEAIANYVKQQQEQRAGFERNRRDSYRQRVGDIDARSANPPLYMLRQCPYCEDWYEQSISGNGRLKTHCKQCCKDWNAARHKVKTQPDWIEISKKRKPCQLCGKKRLVNSNRICKPCFLELESES